MKGLFKMKWLFLLLMAFVLVIGSCKMGTDDSLDGDIDWKDYKTDFGIRVTNSTNKNLIAFQGNLDKQHILGGIVAGESNHGLKNNPAFFGSTAKQFKIIFISEEQYSANKNNLSALSEDIITQIYIFYNGKAGDNEKVYEISDKAGGEYRLQITNDSNFDVELRVGGPSGPTLGYAPKGMVITKLRVGSGEYDVFPVFKYLNVPRDVIETIYPTREDGRAWRRSLTFNTENPPLQVLSLSSVLSSVNKRSSGVAYLVINNNSTSAIGFMKGTTPQLSPLGNWTFSAGTTKQFVIEMPVVSGSDGSFAPELEISNYKVYSGGDEVLIRTKENASTMTLKTDKMYVVNVTGEPGSLSNPFKAEVEIREGYSNGPSNVTFDNLFGP